MNDGSMLRAHLDGGVISRLRMVVRRTVPAHDVDDVVQATLCDALRASRVPDRREDLSRWLVTIAKRRAADFHRMQRKTVSIDGESPSDDEKNGLTVEWRDAVGRAVADAEGDAQTRRALELSLREAEGESYSELARSESMTEVAMRQRVSRFRRRMAAKWLAAVALGVAVAWAGQRAIVEREDAPLILPDAVDRVVPVLRSLSGRWDVLSWSGAEPLLGVSAIELEGTSLRLVSPAGDRVLTVLDIDREASGQARWRVRAGSHVANVLVKVDGSRASVTLDEGRWSGTALLLRR
jgi:DNA-directed RNA polymerase specialized sigma24 family protein